MCYQPTMAYTDVHRAFLQAMTHHGAFTAEQAHTMLLSLYEKYHAGETVPSELHLVGVITSINAKIARYSQKIKLIRYEPTGTEYYVFCNLSDRSPIDRLQTCYTESEVAYFWLVLKEIACGESQSVNPIVCLNLNVQITNKPVSKVRAEELMEEWTKAGYFFPRDGLWILGPRTVAEFGHFLRAQFEDKMSICSLCKEACFYGVKCHHCPETFHTDCIKTYHQHRLKICPECNELWTPK